MQLRRKTDTITAPRDPGAKPRRAVSQRWLRTVFGSVLWFATTALVVAASFVPEVAPDDLSFWRIALGVPAVLLGLITAVVGPRMSERNLQLWLELSMIPALAVNLALLQITPATQPVLFNMIITLVYAGYWLRLPALILTLTGATGIAFSTLITDPAAQAPHIGSFLVVYIPTLVLTALLLRLQGNETTGALNQAHRRARTDPLTGLANLRGLERAARDELVVGPDSKRSGVTGLLLIDLDNFKSANTKYGHLGGDYALRMVAQQMQRVSPKSVLIARVGGDEFAVLVRAESREHIVEFGEILRGAVRGAGAVMEMSGVEIDAAVGSAVFPEDGRDLSELLDVADKSMYAAKGAKRHTFPNLERAATDPEVRPAWMDSGADAEPPQARGPVSLDSITGKYVPFLATRSLYTRASAIGWVVGSISLGCSLLVSDAYPDPMLSPWIILFGGLAFAVGVFFINVQAGSRLHLAFDIFGLVGLAGIIALTGGFASAAPPLVILLVASQAWFWQTRKVAFRLVGPILVVFSPLAYSTSADHAESVLNLVTAYAEAMVIAIVVLSMYFNRSLLTQLRERAEHLATIDPLTGVSNRRAFDAYVQAQLDAEGGADQFAIVMIDLDDFKQVNTAHGHRAGDHVLIGVARALQEVAREDDCVARIGGDEFAAVLPGVGVDGARSLAERFVSAVSAAPEARDTGVGASAGFALHPLHGTTLDQLVFTADGALMAVKATGKGSARVARVVTAI